MASFWTRADRLRVLEHAGTSIAAVRLFELLPWHPIVSVAYAVKHLQTSKPTAGRAVQALEQAGVLVEFTGENETARGPKGYLDRLRIGTEIE